MKHRAGEMTAESSITLAYAGRQYVVMPGELLFDRVLSDSEKIYWSALRALCENITQFPDQQVLAMRWGKTAPPSTATTRCCGQPAGYVSPRRCGKTTCRRGKPASSMTIRCRCWKRSTSTAIISPLSSAKPTRANSPACLITAANSSSALTPTPASPWKRLACATS